jgi:hypothetical protein
MKRCDYRVPGSARCSDRKRGDVAGLVLNGFAELNEHLLPGQSMQNAGAWLRRRRGGERRMARQHASNGT